MKTSWKIKLKCTTKAAVGGKLPNVCKSCIPNEWQGEGGRGIHSLLSEDEEMDEGVRTGEVVQGVLAGAAIFMCFLRQADRCLRCRQTEDNNYIPGLTITAFLHP